jgi:hypothetical protein
MLKGTGRSRAKESPPLDKPITVVNRAAKKKHPQRVKELHYVAKVI